MTDWLGNLPSWVSAIAASCALIFTSWTAYNSQRSAKASEMQAQIATEQQRQRDEKEDREQASKVAAWLFLEQHGNGPPVFHVRYVNTGPLPAYRLLVTPVRRPSFKLLIPVVEPTWGVRSVRLENLTVEVQELGRKMARESDGPRWVRWILWWTGSPDSNMRGMDIESSGVTMQFRDASGIVWRRAPSGQLSKVESGLGASSLESYLDELESGSDQEDVIEIAGASMWLEYGD